MLAVKSAVLNSYGIFQPKGPNFRRSLRMQFKIDMLMKCIILFHYSSLTQVKKKSLNNSYVPQTYQ